MKMFGLFVTIALVLPLAACERRDQCDSGGWCDGTTPVYACYRDRDCPPNNYCDQHGVCVANGPIPPGRGDGGVDAHATGGATGQGGSTISGIGGFTGQGGSTVSGTGGFTGQGGSTISGSGGATGQGGSTQPPPDAGHTCGTDGGPSCHPHPTPVCQFNHDCGLTGRCVDGECQPGCAANADCGTGQVCTGGFCTTSTTSGGQCVFNADCSGSATCINGYCHADCTSSADCAAHGAAHDVCVSGICQPNSGPQPECRASVDCVGVHVTEDVCVDAVCRTPCFSNDDCCVGSSGSVCQMGYCVTAHEVAPQCHVSTDCGTALTCIDATCE
jgi:hypothetical protein